MRRVSTIDTSTDDRLFKSSGFIRASQALEGFDQNTRVVGLTKGQFSFMDLLVTLCQKIGPCDICVSTWTSGIQDAQNAQKLIGLKMARSFTMIVDRSFKTRQPKYVQGVFRALKGEIYVTRTHAKFATLSNENWKITLRTSMNLNKNPRVEYFEIENNENLYNFFQEFVDDVIATCPKMDATTGGVVEQGFKGLLTKRDNQWLNESNST